MRCFLTRITDRPVLEGSRADRVERVPRYTEQGQASVGRRNSSCARCRSGFSHTPQSPHQIAVNIHLGTHLACCVYSICLCTVRVSSFHSLVLSLLPLSLTRAQSHSQLPLSTSLSLTSLYFENIQGHGVKFKNIHGYRSNDIQRFRRLCVNPS